MATASLPSTLRKVFDEVRDSADHGDGELLARYRGERDQDAFGSLVRRHGPMVLGVCQRVLRDTHAADDAFQATFLVLAKKADAVRPPDRLAPWLYGVAYRTALKARGQVFRRQQVEQDYATEVATRPTPAASESTDLLPVIDEQLNALPEKYRTPLLLCGVQGLSKTEAAERLRLPEGTVSSRLARARDLLRERLVRRGVAVPAVAFAALFSADALQAAVPATLASSTAEIALGTESIPAPVLALSNEVIRSMTLLKLQFLGTIAMAATLVGGGFGVLAIQADDKKPQPVAGDVKKPQPADPNRPAKGDDPNNKKPNGDNPNKKPGGDDPNRKEGDKPAKPAIPPAKPIGKIVAVDAKENTITLAVKGDGGVNEKVMKVPAAAKVLVDGKEAKLADVPKGSLAAVLTTPTKEGTPAEVTELRVTGSNTVGVIKSIDASNVSLESEKNPQTFKLTPATKVTLNGKDAKTGELKAGDKVAITLSADGGSVLSLTGGVKTEGDKPVKTAKFAGKITTVDAAAKTITIAGKGEGNDIVVKLTADAKVTVDGKESKLSNIAKGATATFTLVAAKDGQPREANEVAVAGSQFGGSIKQVDKSSVTIGTEKADRVLKVLPETKFVVNGKDAKLADLKVGDRVMATLASDESGAVLFVVGGKKPEGDKPKPEGDKPKPEGDKPKPEKAKPGENE